VLSLLAQTQGLNIVAANDIDAIISITLRNVPVEEALTAILQVANYTWVCRNNIIMVTSLTNAANLPADTQGRQLQVFELDFASANVVAEAVRSLLSPVGKVSVSPVSSTDNRRTRELVVVEDLPHALSRIAAYIHYVDQPPRQVLIEAHILQVTLRDNFKHGVDFNALLRAAGSNITLKSAGLASATASPAFLATVEGGDLGSVIECLQNTTDAKTLGTPKLLVLNGQEAMFHVGKDIGYQGSQTTTETSTFQNVQFLQVGVVLRITPQITRDGRVLLRIQPEVSDGQINTTTNVPDKSTTELQTDVMLSDGQGMIIGGLIKETDSTVQTKIPWLGNVRGIGWFLRRSERNKDRDEVIIAVLPRIQPYEPQWQAYEQGELVKVGVPLFHGPLRRNYRPWDPILPDGVRVTLPLIPKPGQIPRAINSPSAPITSGYVVPPYPLPVQQFDGAPCDGCEVLPGQVLAQPLLSDELLPQPQLHPQPATGGQWPGAEIISDQK
jgi:type II secretory pathway component GspD/PulD (secretin)